MKQDLGCIILNTYILIFKITFCVEFILTDIYSTLFVQELAKIWEKSLFLMKAQCKCESWTIEKAAVLCCAALSRVWCFATLWTEPAWPLHLWGSSRQECWSGLPCPLLGIFQTQGSKPGLPHGRWIFYWLEPWTLKNWCFWTVVLEKTLESPLDSKEIKQVNPKGNQPWLYIGRAGAKASAPIPWLPDAKSWLIRKDPNAGKDWR